LQEEGFSFPGDLGYLELIFPHQLVNERAFPHRADDDRRFAGSFRLVQEPGPLSGDAFEVGGQIACRARHAGPVIRGPHKGATMPSHKVKQPGVELVSTKRAVPRAKLLGTSTARARNRIANLPGHKPAVKVVGLIILEQRIFGHAPGLGHTTFIV
jgi:hypothetical protein